ncbi:MAG: hypothetical protein N7Q72_03180, partial [Spiroplasma sp. Tabriz.8]|nr:hypothetical protein [Spiroplasma sp. Tabriz.8]
STDKLPLTILLSLLIPLTNADLQLELPHYCQDWAQSNDYLLLLLLLLLLFSLITNNRNTTIRV